MDTQHSQITQDNGIQHHAGPWPWYVLLISGIALTGLFPWFMVCLAVFQRGSKKAVVLPAAANLAIYFLFGWILLTIKVPWWHIPPFVYLFNIIWAYAAFLFQSKMIGPASRRYIFSEWKSWFQPILTGFIIGFCLVAMYSISTVLETRAEMKSSIDILDRVSVLWDLIWYSFLGIPAGLLLGFWWAGERDQFSSSHVITFLAAFFVTSIFWGMQEVLIYFIIYKGALMEAINAVDIRYALVPPWTSGYPMYLDTVTSFVPAILIVPFLFGAAPRIRDFFKCLLLIPLAFLCAYPLYFMDNDWWESIEGQVKYELSSPDTGTRESAYQWMETILKRYPEAKKWPKHAERLACNYYKKGMFDKSKAMYKEIVDKYSDSLRWLWHVRGARDALASPGFGKPGKTVSLDIPIVDYEDYLTPNWMALLSVIRFWEGRELPESKIKIQLKELSRSSDKIILSPLETYAALDDAVNSLGYKLLILPAEIDTVKTLISADIPVIHQGYKWFFLISGFNDSKSFFLSSTFYDIPKRVRLESRKEAKEILSSEKEGHGESRKRLQRIALEIYDEDFYAFWKRDEHRYLSPLIAVVFPDEKTEALVTALGSTIETLEQESEGYLAALIGFAFFNQAHPIQTVEWARMSSKRIDSPLPAYVAALAKKQWDNRVKFIRAGLSLQRQFPELDDTFRFFNRTDISDYLRHAEKRLLTDMINGVVPWYIMDSYIMMLDKNDPDEQEVMIQLMKKRVSLFSSYRYLKTLADVYDYTGNVSEMTAVLKQLISVSPYYEGQKIRLAYSLVRLERFAEAKEVLDNISSERVKFKSDYFFCLGAVAEWEGKLGKALDLYKKAVEMRPYKPFYHLKFGQLLLKEKKTDEGKKALEWALRTTADETTAKQAKQLLSETKN